jgi:hypothetical protein
MSNKRTELQREVVEALVASKAINFEAVGSVLSKFAERAALAGDELGVIISWHVIDACIPPFPFHVQDIAIDRTIGQQAQG